jgi:hypothetical protein
LFATDGWMTVVVLRTSLFYVQDSFRDFTAALLAMPRFRQTFSAVPDA